MLDEVETRIGDNNWEDWENTKIEIEDAVDQSQNFVRNKLYKLDTEYQQAVQVEEAPITQSPYSIRILTMVEEFSGKKYWKVNSNSLTNRNCWHN